MSAKRGADLLAEGLRAAGVGRIFTLSGNQIMPIFDACIDAEIELLHVRHEAAAVHMADAWGRFTGEPGIAMVTGGPGHANAVSALYSALMSESPVVLISGHAPQGQLGQGAFQEMAQAQMATPVCKAATTVREPGEFGSAVAEALYLASAGRPGPVHISAPFDLLNETVNGTLHWAGPTTDCDANPSELLVRLRTAIALHARPLVVAGPLALRTLGDTGLVALSLALGAPVVASDSPRGVGDPALGAFAEVLARADLVVSLGRPIDFTLKMGRVPAVAAGAKFVLLDPSQAVIDTSKRAIGDVSRVQWEARVDVRGLIRVAQADTPADGEQSAWMREVFAACAHRPTSWQRMVSQTEGALHAVEVARAIQSVYGDFATGTLVMDGGEFGQWAQACLRAPRQTTNGPGGAIGSALPMAMAARVAVPDEPVLAVMGDGTCGFHLSEFETAVRYGLDFVAIVGNDACWNAEYQIQLRDFGPQRLVGCELTATRYDKVVEAMGGHGEFVTRAQDLPGALQRARHSGLPACVNVALERNPAPSVTLAMN